MGLDQYLRVKTKTREANEPTGICGGFFPMAPDNHGMVEVGYLRKAYEQADFIMSFVSGSYEDDNCVDMLIPNDSINTIIKEAKLILKTHKFDKEGFDLDDSSEGNTWNSKAKWQDVVKMFTEAKKIIKKDPTAEVYYHQWY